MSCWGGSSVPFLSFLSGTRLGRDAASIFPSWLQLTGPSSSSDVNIFSDLLLKTTNCEASDERDRVFGLLGLIPSAYLDGLVAD